MSEISAGDLCREQETGLLCAPLSPQRNALSQAPTDPRLRDSQGKALLPDLCLRFLSRKVQWDWRERSDHKPSVS